ncbi:hypothetical protein Tco_1387666, partial [Tanacetum coccineum]
PPLYTGNFMPPTPDLSFTGLDEFVNEPVVENCKAMSSEEESKVVRKYDDALSIGEWVSDDEEEDVSQPKTEKKTVRPSIIKKEFIKSKQQQKTARKTVKQVEQHSQNTHCPRGNQRNWNNMMSQKLGINFEMFNKACYVCGSFDHLQNLVPRAVLMKSGLVSINTARQVNAAQSKAIVNAARPMSYLSKIAHSTGNPQMNLQDQGVIDNGCLKHMTGNMSYLTNYKEIDGGYVSFRGNPKGGKITRKGKAKKSVRLMMEKLFGMELELILVPQPSDPSENVADEAIHKELGDSLVRAATTASSLEVEQDSGGGPECQETIGDTTARTRFDSVSKHSNDSLLARGNTLRSDEDTLKLNELMELCTTLQTRILDLEKTKTT